MVGRDVLNQTASSHAKQRELLAAHVAELSKSNWLLGSRSEDLDHAMGSLLINVYLHSALGQPLNQKDAWQKTGLRDIKTGRAYISRAEAMGWIKVSQSDQDKRMKVIEPTDAAKTQIDAQIDILFQEVRRLMKKLVDYGLPDDGSPVLLNHQLSNVTSRWDDKFERGR